MGDPLADVRDIAIVLLALESLVIGVLLALMLVQIRKLVRVLRKEITPIVDSASETAKTVHGTVDLVSQTVVDPVIKASSYFAGARQVVRNLLFLGRKVEKRPLSDADETSNQS